MIGLRAQGHSLKMFCIPHDEALALAPAQSTQPRVAAACDSHQLRLVARVHISKHTHAHTHTHTHTAGSETATYGFDPDPTHLNAGPCGTVRRGLFLSVTESVIIVRDGCFFFCIHMEEY